MEICVKFSLFPYFLFFLVFKHDFIRWFVLPASQLQAEQVMTSQIRSHVEYLIYTYYILALMRSFCSRNWWKI